MTIEYYDAKERLIRPGNLVKHITTGQTYNVYLNKQNEMRLKGKNIDVYMTRDRSKKLEILGRKR